MVLDCPDRHFHAIARVHRRAGRPFDAVLVNEFLPDMSSEELLRRLRRACPSTSCVVMQPSAREVTDSEEFLGLGAFDVVCKREQRDIVAAIRAATGRQETPDLKVARQPSRTYSRRAAGV